jgi:16S rRNA (guanine527-N7)-methyltransferase
VQESLLEALLEPAGLDALTRSRLARYGTLVLQANRRFNLTGATTAQDLAGHLLDSLTVLPWIKEPYVDVGTGAGLPSIPVAIARGIPVTLIEATSKKARFLVEALQELNLRGDVIARRAEIAAQLPALRERFASGTARAVGGASTVAELLVPFIAVGGVAVLQRGTVPTVERTALDDASLMLGAAVEWEQRVGGERRILLIRKMHATPARFPRRPGIPAKRPLCLAQEGQVQQVSRRTSR